jgi:hypothetical protein
VESIRLLNYLPSASFHKHHTIVNVARQPVTLLGPGNKPLDPQRLDYAGKGDINLPGYAHTTAQIAGRTPETSLMLGTLFSSQYPIPGAGMYFPETTGVNIKGAGYQQTFKTSLTSNVYDLMKGKIGFTPSLKEGQVLPSALQYEYGKLTLPGEQPGETKDRSLYKRMGSANFVVGDQTLRVPKYYDPLSGTGAAYNKARLDTGSLREVTEADLESIRQRMGINVIADELTSEVGYELSGMSKQNAKIATGGVKTDIVPYRGTPGISFTSTGGEQRNLPISMLTFEAKSMPEAYLNSLAALSHDQQSDLLEDYAASYEQADPGTAQAIREYRNRLANRRTTLGPDVKFRPEELAAHAFTTNLQGEALGPGETLPIHELGKDIFSRLFLGGMSGGDLGKASEKDLMALAGSQTNVRNLEKYGIGWIAPGIQGMDIEPIIREVSESDVNALKYAFTQSYAENIRSQGLPEEDPSIAEAQFYQTYGFDSAQTGKMRTQRFTPTGFRMPMAAQPSVEFVGGGSWKAEEVMLLNQIAPTFAGRLGLSLMDITSEAAMSRNITDPVHWAQAQIAKTASIAAARGTKPVYDPEALTITSDMAQRMLSDPDFTNLMEKDNANLVSMETFLDKYEGYFPGVDRSTRRLTQFEGAEGHYLMPPQAIRNIMDVEDEDKQEDVTRSINMYMGGFYKALQATASGDGSQVVRGTSRLIQHFEETFGLPEGSKKSSIRSLLGSDLARQVGHYAYWDKLQQQQIYGSEELIKSTIRMELGSQGLDVPGAQLTEGEVEETYKYLSGQTSKVGKLPSYAKERGLPAVMARYPFVAGVESMAMAQVLTPEHMKRMGIEAPADDASGLSNYHWRMGIVPSTGFQGDFDLDYLMVSLGLKGTRDKKGQLRVNLAAFDKAGKIDPQVLRQIQKTANASYPDTMRSLFASATQRTAFDPLMGTLKQDERPTTAGGLGGIASMIGTQMDKAKLYSYDALAEKVATFGAAKMQMGTTYDYTRALESAATVRGWGSDKIFRARRGRAGQYQPFLDVSTGVPQPLVNMFQSSYLQEKGGDLYMGWRAPGMKMNEDRGWVQGYKVAGDESAFQLLRGMAGSAIYPHKEAGMELPSPDILSWAFSPDQERAFDPETITPDEIAKSDAAYQAMIDAKEQTLPAADIDRLRKEYYSGISLESALKRPFEDQDMEFDERKLGMQDALVEWMRVNYGDTPEKVFESPHMTAQLGKAIQSKQNRIPGWELPSRFTGTTVGQDISAVSGPFQTMFGLERNRLAPANKLLDLANWLDKQQPQSSIANFALGFIKNTMGFGMVKQMSDFRNLYQQIEQSPVELRASEYMGIADPKAYDTMTTLGLEKGLNPGLLKSALYSVGGILGISGREEMHDLTGAIFPIGAATPGKKERADMPTQRENIERGVATEMALGGVMTRGQHWYTTNRWTINPDTGEMEPTPESELGLRRRSAFNVQLQHQDPQGKSFKTNFGATTDFLRLTRDDKGLLVTSVEVKAPGAWRRAKSGGEEGWTEEGDYKWVKGGTKIRNTFAHIQAGIAEDATAQSKGTSYIAAMKARLIQGGSAQDLAELRETLGAYGIPEGPLMDEAVQSALTRGVPAQALIAQEGSALYQEIHSAKPDPEKINQYLDEDPYGTLFTPSGIDDPRFEEIGANVERAAQTVHANRPKALADVWRRLQAAPGFWGAQLEIAANKRNPELGRLAGRSLDIARLAWHGMRAIGGAAEQAVGISQIPVQQATTAIREAGMIGPYTQEVARGAGLTAEEFNKKLLVQRASIEQHAQSGKPMEVEGGGSSGLKTETQAKAIGEIARQMGYRSNVNLYEVSGAASGQSSEVAQMTFTPIEDMPRPPVPPMAPTPPTPVSGRPWESTSEWQDLNNQYAVLGGQLNQARIAGDDTSGIEAQMRGVEQQMRGVSGRFQQGGQAEYAQALMGHGTAQQRYQEELKQYPAKVQEWKTGTTVNRIPTPAGAIPQTPAQAPAQQQQQAAGFAGPIPAGGNGGAGTTVSQTSTTSTAPTPDPTSPGLVRPTATIQQFTRMYDDYRNLISQQAYEFRQALGGTERGKAIGALGQMSPEDVRDQFQQFRYTAGLASQLHGLAQKAATAKGFDPNLVHPDFLKMAEEIRGTESEAGRDVLDMMTLMEMGTTGTEGVRRNLQQSAAFELGTEISSGGFISGIRSAAGLSTVNAQNQPIMGLSGLLGGNVPVDTEPLMEHIKSTPGLQDLLRRAYKISRGTSGKEREEIFGRSPQFLDMANLAEQVSRLPGGEFVTRSGGEPSGTLSPGIAQEHSERLNRLSSELADNFEKLRTKTGDYGQELERRTELIRSSDIEKKRLSMYEAAAPLEAAGVARPVQRQVAPGAPAITDYELTGQPVPPELIGKQQDFVTRQEELQTLEESRRSGFRPDEQQNYMARLLRRTLGGFGLMYMRSLWNIGTGGLGFGMQERLGLDQMLSTQMADVTGQGVIPPNQMQTIANQTALAGTAYTPLLGLQSAAAQYPFVRDARTAAGAGLGTYAFLQQMGMWGGEQSGWAAIANGGLRVGLPGGRGFNVTSGRLATGVGLAALTMSALSNTQDAEGLAYRYSRVSDGGLQALSTYASMDTVSHLISMATNPEYRKSLQEMDWTRQVSGQGFSYDTLTQGMTPAEQTQFLTRSTKLAIEKSPQYAPETMAKVMSFMARNNLADTQQLRETLAEQFQSGVADEELVSQMLGTFGFNAAQQYSQPYLAQGIQTTMLGDTLMAMTTTPPDYQQRMRMMSGMQFAQGIGAASYYIPGVGGGGGPSSYQAQMAQLDQWAQFEGTPAGSLWQMQYQNWYRDLQYGGQAPAPTAPTTQNPLDLLRQQISEEYSSKQVDVKDAYARLTEDYLRDVVAPGHGPDYANIQLQGMDLEEQERELKKLQSVVSIRQFTRESLGRPSTPQDYQDLLAMSVQERETEGERRQRIAATAEQLRQRNMPAQEIQTRIDRMMGMGIRDVRREEQQIGAAGDITSAFRDRWGLDAGQRQVAYQEFMFQQQQGKFGLWKQDFYSRLSGMDPWALTQAYAYGEQIPGLGEQVPGWMVTKDILGPQFGALDGMPMNLPAFTLSGASHPQFQNLQKMLGSDIFGTDAGRAFSQGYQANWSGNLAIPGLMGMQSYMADQQYKTQMAGIGNQMAQWQLGYAFNTGVGINKYAGIINPQTGSPFGFNTGQFGFNIPGAGQYTSQGGGFWGVQDASRNLGFVQQEWQHGFQQQQMQMQQRQWGESFGLQQRQAMMQRPWAKEDWAYQDMTRGLQWGWKQEDFAEQRRFMTGRDRRLAERQMRRETVMHDLEGEQIDKQRERQKETWKLEDERFDLSRKHNQEQLDMQRQQMSMSKEFYEERKRLEEEQVLLQRAYQMEQMNLQKQSIGLQAKMAKDAKDAQDIQNAINLLMLVNSGILEDLSKNMQEGEGMTKQLMESAFGTLIKWLDEVGIKVEGITGAPTQRSTTTSGPVTDPNNPFGPIDDPKNSAVGNYLSAGDISYVNEQQGELFRPYWSGEVIPLTKYDPWQTTVMDNNKAIAQASQPRMINIYIGNRHLGEFILDEIEGDLRIL